MARAASRVRLAPQPRLCRPLRRARSRHGDLHAHDGPGPEQDRGRRQRIWPDLPRKMAIAVLTMGTAPSSGCWVLMSVGYRRRGPGRAAGADLVQNLDYPVLNEYRTVLGGLFSSIYGLNATQLNAVFGGATPKPLELLSSPLPDRPWRTRRRMDLTQRGASRTSSDEDCTRQPLNPLADNVCSKLPTLSWVSADVLAASQFWHLVPHLPEGLLVLRTGALDT